MGYDADDAQAEYDRVRALGYSDEEIMAMDEWPQVSSPEAKAALREYSEPETPAMRARREGRAALARDRYLDAMFDQDGTMSASEAAAFQRRYRLETGSTAGRFQITHPNLTGPKEPKMPINTRKTATELRALIAEATKTLALLEKTPDEPAERMTTFGVTFDGSENVYTYVALRINGRWSVSGRHFVHGRYLWHEIFERFDSIHATVKYMATPVEFRNEKIN